MARRFVPILASLRPRTRFSFRSRLVADGGCLVFSGVKNKAGYGIVEVSYDYGKRRYPILAHRLAWALEHGVDPPEDRIVCHKRQCPNKACCNPKHLYLGTPQTNYDDSKSVGTAFQIGDIVRGRRGVNHPAARYSAEKRGEVIEFLRRQDGGLHFGRASAHFGIHNDTISRWWREWIVSRETVKGTLGVTPI